MALSHACNLFYGNITVQRQHCRVGRGGAVASKARSNSYSYDAVYEAGSSQEAVFADVEPVVTSVMDGYNVCIFAYGQTGLSPALCLQSCRACGLAPVKHELHFGSPVVV